MTKKMRAYIILIISVGIVCCLYCVFRAAPYFQKAGVNGWINVGVLIVLMVLCHMLPIYIGKGRAMDISFVPVLACAMTSHYSVAVVLFVVSTLFGFMKEPNTRGFFYPYARYTFKEVFNTANVALCLTTVGWFFDFLSITPGTEFSVRMLLLFTAYALAIILINFLVFILYYYLGDERKFVTLIVKNITGIIPSIVATIPLSLILGMLLNMPQGYLYVVLLMVPLLMARHSFKMYLDSHSLNVRIIASLCNAIDAKDHYTQGHSMRVAYLCKVIAEEMKKQPPFIEDLTIAAMLHDVGKIGINDAVLLKKGALTPAEYDEIKMHPAIGERIIRSVNFPETVTEGVLYHHMRYDKTGYPDGVPVPAQIPESAAILAVADCFDAMISDRPYRKGMSVEEAVAIIREGSGTQLHPQVVDAFLQVYPRIDIEHMVLDMELEMELFS